MITFRTSGKPQPLAQQYYRGPVNDGKVFLGGPAGNHATREPSLASRLGPTDECQAQKEKRS